MKLIRWVVLLVVLAALLVSGAGIHSAVSVRAMGTASCNTLSPTETGATGTFVAAGNDFGFRLYRQLAGTHTESNVFVSPVSVMLALDMAASGARGATQRAMSRTLGLTNLGVGASRMQAAALITALHSTDPHAQLAIANSLWVRRGLGLQPTFIRQARRDFAARISSLDFGGGSAPATINGWVRCATHGTIPSVIDRIPADVMLYLINSVYFQGQWTNPFKPQSTHTHTFSTGSGKSAQIPLMDQSGNFPYYAGSNFQAISLPYARGRFTMVVILPTAGTSIGTIAARLSASDWNHWQRHLQVSHGEIAIPRFSLAESYQLNTSLSSLGMAQAFTDSANFSGMCLRPCKLSEIRHKTYLQVDEHGTVASGVTSVGVVPTAIQADTFHMVVDRPFMVAIRDTRTGAVLFLGGVNAPNAQ